MNNERDMEVEESGEVVVEEESIITTCLVGEREARWAEMSTIGGEVATMAWEVGRGTTVVEVVGGDFGCSTSIFYPSRSGSSWIIDIFVMLLELLCFLEDSPSESYEGVIDPTVIFLEVPILQLGVLVINL